MIRADLTKHVSQGLLTVDQLVLLLITDGSQGELEVSLQLLELPLGQCVHEGKYSG